MHIYVYILTYIFRTAGYIINFLRFLNLYNLSYVHIFTFWSEMAMVTMIFLVIQ